MNKMMLFLKKIDRRVIYFVVLLSILLPFFPGFGFLKFPVKPLPETIDAFSQIDKLNPGDAVFMDLTYEPSSKAELLPVTESILKHAFEKKLKVLIYYYNPNAIALGTDVINKISREPNYSHIKEGVDYVHLGWLPITADMMLSSMSVNVKSTFNKDGEIFNSVRSLSDIKLLCVMAAGTIGTTYSELQKRFGYNLILAVTAINGPDLKPLYQTGQVKGLSVGLRGCAEYEQMLVDKYKNKAFYQNGTRGMSSLTLAHLVIIGFIIIGNILYFYENKNKKRVRG